MATQDQSFSRSNSTAGLQVSLFCVQLTSPVPDGSAGATTSNYFSGLVDLPEYNNGFDYQPMGSLSNGIPFINFMNGVFTVGYQINCLAADYQPSAVNFQTFILPYYVDGIFSGNGGMNPDQVTSVIVNIYDSSGVQIPTAKKQGTVANLQSIKGGLTMGLTLNVITGSPTEGNIDSYLIQSSTQNKQFFAILWSTGFVGDNQSGIYPLMYYPQMPPFDVDGSSTPPVISCALIWNWNQSPAWNKSQQYPSVAPFSIFPNFMNLVGCLCIPVGASFSTIQSNNQDFPLNTTTLSI